MHVVPAAVGHQAERLLFFDISELADGERRGGWWPSSGKGNFCLYAKLFPFRPKNWQ